MKNGDSNLPARFDFHMIEFEISKPTLPFSKKTYFRDLSRILPSFRRPKSKVLQIYSKVHNIGNYIPVIGIRELIDDQFDVWDAHDLKMDWDFINNNYSFVLVGGAGLLHACFDHLWKGLEEKCQLPMMIWGVGVCFPYNEVAQGASKSPVRNVFKRALLSNVRDTLTAEHYGISNIVDISPCPSLAYISRLKEGGMGPKEHLIGRYCLQSFHNQLCTEREASQISNFVRSKSQKIVLTDNIQRFNFGIEDILRLYKFADLVVTSRLHGAIIAYGFGTPFIALSRDPKISAFSEAVGHTSVYHTIPEIFDALSTNNTQELDIERGISSVKSFGFRAKSLLSDLGLLSEAKA